MAYNTVTEQKKNVMNKYPRTTKEAFPHTAEYGASIEIPYKKPFINKLFYIVCVIGFVVLLCDLFIWRP